MRYREECIGELIPRIYLPSVFVSTFAIVFIAIYLSFNDIPLALIVALMASIAVLILVRPIVRRISESQL